MKTDTHESNEKDSGFYKIFLEDFTESLSSIANQKTKIFCWIIKNMKKNSNEFNFSYEKISKETKASYATVAETMETLQEKDFLRKRSSGSYIINPDIIFWGSYGRRVQAYKAYHELEMKKDKNSEQKQLEKTNREIRKLQARAERLQKNIDLKNFSPGF